MSLCSHCGAQQTCHISPVLPVGGRLPCIWCANRIQQVNNQQTNCLIEPDMQPLHVESFQLKFANSYEYRCAFLPVQTCNLAPCQQYFFDIGRWSICTASCGGGTQARLVTCVEQSSGRVVDDSWCSGFGAKKPASTQQCNNSPCPGQAATWAVDNIDPCNRPICGGVQRRSITCRSAQCCCVQTRHPIARKSTNSLRVTAPCACRSGAYAVYS
jgi:Thrombospondin type 1 domain